MRSWKTTAFGWTAAVIIVMQVIQGMMSGDVIDFNSVAKDLAYAFGLIVAKDLDVTGGGNAVPK